MSKATIEKLYAAFAALDAKTMAQCYADDAHFDDEAFSLRGRHQIGGMWSMLIEAIKKQGRKDWKLEVRDITENSAHWEPTYRFSATGRMVHNIIDAEFEFDSQGLIKRQARSFRLLALVASGARHDGCDARLVGFLARQGQAHRRPPVGKVSEDVRVA